MKYHCSKVKDVEKDLSTSIQKGLSSKEAINRLQKFGRNELKEGKKKSKFILFLEQFNSPVIYILIGALIISAILGEYVDSIVIFVILIVNAIVGYIQEARAEKEIEALKKLSSLQSVVLRDGKEILVESSLIVPGDILVLETGNKIPADGRIVFESNLETQESALTGESNPVKKIFDVIKDSNILAERKNIVFSGTIVTKGRAKCIVIKTGMKSEIGKIAKLIQNAKPDPTPLQKKLKVLARWLGIIVGLISVIVFFGGVLKGEGILEMFIFAVAIAVAAIPEGLPVVVTIALATGIKRMVKKNALVRKLPSVETLGSTTVICSDKTGTLTRNEMTVRKLYVNGKEIDVKGLGYGLKGDFFIDNEKISTKNLELLLKIGVLNNDSNLSSGKIIGDPTEGALLVSGGKSGLLKKVLNNKFPRVNEIPFSSERKMMSTIHKVAGKKVLYSKGATEILLNLCDRINIDGKVRKITLKDKTEINEKNSEFAFDALRVLAFAYSDGEKEKNLIFVGLQAMIDPPREEAKKAIKECNAAGIKVVMITGDNELTAKAIARELGLNDKSMNGKQLERVKDFSKIVSTIDIYARVNPEHKLKIVSALKKKGHVVAMTGDGVNDAPALKKSDIGIAMGITGTDVAKEASAMILTDDNFASIVDAVEEGRGIYGNIRKFFAYLISGNIGEVLILFLAILFGWPIALTVTQLLLINLITDGLPALALSVDPFEPKAMSRKPVKQKEPIYRGLNPFIIYYPIVMTVVGLSVFYYFNFIKGEYLQAQTATFLTIAMFELYQAFASRSTIYPSVSIGIFKNKKLVLAVVSSFLIILGAIYIPILSRFLDMVPLGINELLVIIGISSIGAIVIEVSKALRLKFSKLYKSNE